MMKKESSPYYKTLADLAGEGKFEALDAIQTAHKKMREIYDANPGLMHHVQTVQNFASAIRPIRELMKPLIESHRAITEYLETHKHLSQNIHTLPANGWYFSIEFIDSMGMADLDIVLEKSPEKFESLVANTFAGQINGIVQKLTTSYPKRAPLLQNIFALHAAENYQAAIPLALTQADGMCKDTFFIYRKGKKTPVGFFDTDFTKSANRPQRLSKTLRVPITSIFNVLVNQLSGTDRNTSLVLEGNTKRLSDLNRHSILHGESTDYGTRTNSIKAILLLDFIEDLRVMNEVLAETVKDDLKS